MKNKNYIFWFRNDLRLSDNLALSEAASKGSVFPIFIVHNAPSVKLGEASLCWLHDSLKSLSNSLDNKLNFYFGSPKEIIVELIQRFTIDGIYLNKRFEPAFFAEDQEIEQLFQSKGKEYKSFNSYLLKEPSEVTKDDGGTYKIFTPFAKKGFQNHSSFRNISDKPISLHLVRDHNSLLLEDLHLRPKLTWAEKMMNNWQVGEVAAQKKLHEFVDCKLKNYKNHRNNPGIDGISRLSPHLHFGEISPNQILDACLLRLEIDPQTKEGFDCFLNELVWREFSYYLLNHFPNLSESNFQKEFDKFPWQKNAQFLVAWQRGQTGYPIVDAAMRELWQTGFMHNRCRMIVASFLTKNLLIHWHAGRDWFWNCLLDADVANNSASWQWVAGSGADAAPYFRIFNPVLQGERFDPDGEYTLTYCPELRKLPKKYLFKPWEAPKEVLQQANIELGVNYPKPIVNITDSRKKALASYEQIKSRQLNYSA